MKRRYTILIVDDEDDIKELLTSFFTSKGHHCDTACDGIEALNMMCDADYDAVITDIKMPNMDGIVLTQKIAKRYPGLPVIVMTGFEVEYSEEKVIEAGAGDFIIKPFSMRELSARLRRLMRDYNQQQKLRDMAHIDSLTGIPNRSLFMDRLTQSVEVAKRYKHMLIVLFLDLDRFKVINDTFGHDTGDLLLKETAHRLGNCTRKADTIARLGGDEFVVIMARVEEVQEAETVASKIITSLSQPFLLGEHVCSISVSIGISVFPSDANSAEDLIKKSDEAMYSAKKQGKNNYCLFSKLPAV